MQIDKAFKELVIDRDFTMYYHIARAIVHIEHLFGPIPVKHGKGEASSQILSIIEMLEDEDPEYITEHPLSEIYECILIDREVDMVTPLVTAFTYEALIDDVFGIANSNYYHRCHSSKS